VLPQKLNVGLGTVPSFVDFLGSLYRSFGQFLGLILDLGMEPFEDWENRSLDVLFRLKVGVGNALRIGANILE